MAEPAKAPNDNQSITIDPSTIERLNACTTATNKFIKDQIDKPADESKPETARDKLMLARSILNTLYDMGVEVTMSIHAGDHVWGDAAKTDFTTNQIRSALITSCVKTR